MMAVARHFKLSATMGEMSVQKIKECIGKDIPIILLLQAWAQTKSQNWQNHWNDGHYVVAIGYDKKKIYFEDPYTISHTFLPYKELERRWHGEKRYRIGIVIKGKKKYSSKKAYLWVKFQLRLSRISCALAVERYSAISLFSALKIIFIFSDIFSSLLTRANLSAAINP